MNRAAKGCLWSLAVVVILIAGLFVTDRVLPSNARSHLPESATDIHETYDPALNGDFSRSLRARIPESEVKAYAESIGATESADSAFRFYSFGEKPDTQIEYPEKALYQTPGSRRSSYTIVGWYKGFVFVQDWES